MDTRVDVLVEPLSMLMSEMTEIAARIESVHKSHSARVEVAAAQLRDIITEQVTSNLRQQLDCEFQEAVRVIRSELEERMLVASDQWAVERKSLMQEIASLRKIDRRELSTEIAQSESALNQVRITIETMVNDPSIAIAKLVRAKAREGELAAYLKGLNFQAGTVEAPTVAHGVVAVAGD
jgi:hypothetical protein